MDIKSGAQLTEASCIVKWVFCPTDLQLGFCHTGLRDWDTHQKWSTTYGESSEDFVPQIYSWDFVTRVCATGIHIKSGAQLTESRVRISSHRFTVGILSHGFARLGYTSKVEHNLRRVEWGFCPTDLHYQFCHTGLRDWDTHQKWSTTYRSKLHSQVSILSHRFTVGILSHGFARLGYTSKVEHNLRRVEWVFCPTYLQLAFCHTGLRDWDTHQKWSTTYGESSEDFVPQIYSWDFVTRVCATGIHIKSGAQLTESRVRILSHRFTLSILSHGFARLGYTSKVEHNLQKQAA